MAEQSCYKIMNNLVLLNSLQSEVDRIKSYVDVNDHNCQEHQINRSCKNVSEIRESDRIGIMNDKIYNMKREIEYKIAQCVEHGTYLEQK